MPRFPDRSLPVETARSQATRTALRDMPESDRPRERLRDYGPPQLANAELIAILLRTGTAGESALAAAGRLLARFNGLAGLGRVSYAELCNERGLSDAKACQLLAGLELGRRVAALRPDDRSSISSPADIAALLMPQMSGLEREHLKVVLLNTKNQVLAVHPVYVGSVNAAVVRPAEVFAEAVRRVCPALVVVHNHPSGDPAPSTEDVATTRRLAEAGRILDIDVLDHIVLGQGRFVSMRERRLGFDWPGGIG
ncbi:MAG: JAB domain-containing protein [SAR202 cluster bacterium]|nr:JAB domain-containing protein [SAR202 cluster bacterium]